MISLEYVFDLEENPETGQGQWHHIHELKTYIIDVPGISCGTLGASQIRKNILEKGGWTNLEWYHGGETHMSVDTFLEGVLTLADTMGNKENFLFNCNCLRKIAITCILGITCFPNPFPRSGKYPKHVSPLK